MNFERVVSICSFDKPESRTKTPGEFFLTNFLKCLKFIVTTNILFLTARLYISESSACLGKSKSLRTCFTTAFLESFIKTWGSANAVSKRKRNLGNF